MILSRYSVLANLYLLLSSAHTLFSQKIIEVEYGGSEHEVGYTVIETSNRNILSAGITESLGENNDIYVVKTDLEGNLIWANNYGENKYEYALSLVETTDSNFIIAGRSDQDIILLKIDTSGQELWSKVYSNSNLVSGNKIIELQDGNYIIVGQISYIGTVNTDIYLMKVNTNGDVLWIKSYGGPLNDAGNSIVEDGNGNLYITGYTTVNDPGMQNLVLLKVNATGDSLWSRIYGGPICYEGTVIIKDPDGNFIIGGYSKVCSEYNRNVFIQKVDSNGDTIWTRTIGKPDESNYCYAMIKSFDGRYICASNAYDVENKQSRIHVIQIDGDGDSISTIICGSGQYNWVYGCAETLNRDILLTGSIKETDRPDLDLFITIIKSRLKFNLPDTIISDCLQEITLAPVIEYEGSFDSLQFNWTPEIGLDNPTIPTPTLQSQTSTKYILQTSRKTIKI